MTNNKIASPIKLWARNNRSCVSLGIFVFPTFVLIASSAVMFLTSPQSIIDLIGISIVTAFVFSFYIFTDIIVNWICRD